MKTKAEIDEWIDAEMPNTLSQIVDEEYRNYLGICQHLDPIMHADVKEQLVDCVKKRLIDAGSIALGMDYHSISDKLEISFDDIQKYFYGEEN